MIRRINFYIRIGQLARSPNVIALSNEYLSKAKSNLLTMNILSEIRENNKARKILKIPKEYDSNEWIVITGYYAMYFAALCLISTLGFRSKNHSATLLVLDEFFVKKKLLSEESLTILKNASLKKEELEQISEARHKREIAQYSVTKQTTKNIAEKIKIDAYAFVNRVQEIL